MVNLTICIISTSRHTVAQRLRLTGFYLTTLVLVRFRRIVHTLPVLPQKVSHAVGPTSTAPSGTPDCCSSKDSSSPVLNPSSHLKTDFKTKSIPELQNQVVHDRGHGYSNSFNTLQRLYVFTHKRWSSRALGLHHETFRLPSPNGGPAMWRTSTGSRS